MSKFTKFLSNLNDLIELLCVGDGDGKLALHSLEGDEVAYFGQQNHWPLLEEASSSTAEEPDVIEEKLVEKKTIQDLWTPKSTATNFIKINHQFQQDIDS